MVRSRSNAGRDRPIPIVAALGFRYLELLPHSAGYARVSTQKQEKEGFSIRAQMKLLRAYAEAQGMIHYILRNRIYSGQFEWDGQLCHGNH